VDTRQWTHILTLLSVVVVVDNRVYKEVLGAIYTIATVDGEYHPSEADVIGMARKHWNLSVPNRS